MFLCDGVASIFVGNDPWNGPLSFAFGMPLCPDISTSHPPSLWIHFSIDCSRRIHLAPYREEPPASVPRALLDLAAPVEALD